MNALQETPPGRMFGLDFGARKFGVAVSDELGTLARPLTTLRISNSESVLGEILRLAAEWGITRIIVGLPRNMDGTLGDTAARVLEFVGRLRAKCSLPVSWMDERLSSREADVSEVGCPPVRGRQGARRSIDPGQDARAAAIILQRYLDGESPVLIETLTWRTTPGQPER